MWGDRGEGGAFYFIKIILIGPDVLDRPVSWPPLLLEPVERALMEFKTPADPPRLGGLKLEGVQKPPAQPRQEKAPVFEISSGMEV